MSERGIVISPRVARQLAALLDTRADYSMDWREAKASRDELLAEARRVELEAECEEAGRGAAPGNEDHP